MYSNENEVIRQEQHSKHQQELQFKAFEQQLIS